MNKILGMCIAMAGWPSTLLAHGYRAYAIERGVRVGRGRIVVPDAMFLNEKTGHMLIVDCKGGANVKADQDSRYAQMVLKDILGRTRPPCAVRSHTFAYVIDGEHVDRIRTHTDFALIVFERSAVRGIGDLGDAALTRELQKGVDIRAAPAPQFIAYPFSILDTREDIDKHVTFGMLAYLEAHPGTYKERLVTNAAALDVLRAVHPHLPIFAPSHKAELVGVVRQSIERVCLSGMLSGVKNEP